MSRSGARSSSFGPSVFLLTVVPNELLLAPLLLMGVAGALRMTVTEVLVVDSAPPERRSTVLGSYYLISQEVGGLAAPAFGAAAVIFGIGPAFSGLGVILVAFSAVAVWLGRRM